MIEEHYSPENHHQMRELTALAGSGDLSPWEWSQLKTHLASCEECREVAFQYMVLTTQGIPSLAENYTAQRDLVAVDDADAWKKLKERIREEEEQGTPGAQRRESVGSVVKTKWTRRFARNPLIRMTLAASLIVAVGLEAYRLGARGQIHRLASPSQIQVSNLAAEKRVANDSFAPQAKRLAELEQRNAASEREVERLRTQLRAVEEELDELKETSNQSEEQLQALTQQRDALSTQLQAANQSYQNDRAELTSLRAEREKTLQEVTSLEMRIEELTATNREQERRLADTEQYLASDRDIRELMGARKLYIADVFDVDGGSRTRKAFGRVFYTQGKSLIFYAFDLDRQPTVVNANTFQVWGQKEMPQGRQALPMNLGILYMDNETNRRWVMRFDDPKKLAEIDAVFVTVEPSGGSQKPTTKPFLYALLRKEVNHP